VYNGKRAKNRHYTMRLTSISSIAWLLFCASGVAQNKNAGGIVYGGKAAFNITAPEGWVLDTESGAVAYVVLSCRNEESYRKDKHALEDALKTIFYIRKS
jgi:hypothetical protein